MSLVTGNDCSTLQCYEKFKDSETVDLLSFEEAFYRSYRPSKSGVLVTFTAKKCYVIWNLPIYSHTCLSACCYPRIRLEKVFLGPVGKGNILLCSFLRLRSGVVAGRKLVLCTLH